MSLSLRIGSALILPAITFLQIAVTPGSNYDPQKVTSSGVDKVSLVIMTDRPSYSLKDYIKITAALKNNGDQAAYVDRRIDWTAAAGGLELEIRNEEGKILPSRFLSDALMPPPNEDDTSILTRLEPASLQGDYVLSIEVKDFFPRPGRYSLRVIYKSWLIRETVAPQLRSLPAVWADAPEIQSDPVWIRINATAKRMRTKR